jgi:hypothetical protein
MNRINVLDNFLDPFGAMFTPEVAQQVVAFRVDASTQARIETLADKCTEGQLTAGWCPSIAWMEGYEVLWVACWSSRSRKSGGTR